MLEFLTPILLISGAILIGAISPGPTFVLIARTSMGNSRGDAVIASIGIGFGGIIFALLALMGIHIILLTNPALYILFKIVASIYLLYIALLIWRSCGQSIDIKGANAQKNSSFKRSFLLGFFTQLSNPKAAIAYSTIFAALLPQHFNAWTYLILPICIFIVEAGWYLLVAFALSSPKPRASYLKSKEMIDKITASILSLLGAKLLVSVLEDSL